MIPGTLGICTGLSGGPVPGNPLATVLVQRAANQAVVSGNNITWDTEVYDLGNWFTASSTDIVVPSGISRVRPCGNLQLTADVRHQMWKNGANYSGRSYVGQNSTGGNDTNNALGGIVEVSAGDIFTLNSLGTTTVVGSTTSWYAIEAIDPTFDYVLTNRTGGNQSIPSSTTTPINWNSEVFKTNSALHSTSVNPSHLITLSGSVFARVSGGVLTDVANDQGVLSCSMNGSGFRGMFIGDKSVAGVGNSLQISGASAIVPVTGGTDYFTIDYFGALTPQIVTNSATWGCLEILPSTTRFATVYLGGTQAIGAGVSEPLEFNSVLTDTDGFHSGADPTRLTPPSGYGFTQVRLQGNCQSTSVTGTFTLQVRRTRAGVTSIVVGCPVSENDTAGTDNLNLFGGWMEHQDGDYYELWVTHTTAQTLSDANGTWFCIEAR